MDIPSILNHLSPLGPIPYPPIQKPKPQHLTRDQKRDIQLLHSIGWSYSQIEKQLPFKPTKNQIHYAYTTRPTP